MPDLEVGLLDVVPWTHGYAHSWAIAWMLGNDATRDAVLDTFLADGAAPWKLQGSVEREYKVGRHRADLRIKAIDAQRRPRTMLLETKVNDDLKEAQIEAYCDSGADVVIYGPGLTGMLHSDADPIGCEKWVTGGELVAALEGIELPALLQSYVDEVQVQAQRMNLARECVRGEVEDFPRDPGITNVTGEDVEAVAWVAEVGRLLRAKGGQEVIARNTPHDYGVFWEGSWREPGDFNGAGLYVDVVAAHGGWEYVITVKAGGGTSEDRVRMVESLSEPPGTDWIHGRRSSKENFRVWKLDAGNKSAVEAADEAWEIGQWISSLAEG
jgi:hypothetical protein